MGTLTKRELVVTIANETGLVQHQVFDVVQRTLDHITDALAKGDTVELRNFGILEVRLTKPRVGRNPKTGDRVEVPAKKIPFFKPSKELKDLVNTAAAEAAAAPSAPPAPPQ